jgi:hypothetical protein
MRLDDIIDEFETIWKEKSWPNLDKIPKFF